MTVSDGVSPSPKGEGAKPARLPLNPQLVTTMLCNKYLKNRVAYNMCTI